MVFQNSELHPVLSVVMEVTVKLGERGCLSEPRNKISNILKTGIVDKYTHFSSKTT